MEALNPQGKAVIFSAPSGSGKTTIVQSLLEAGLPLTFSISATSREPRGKEVDGKDYHFIGINGFKEMIENDELVEWEEVYVDQFYGTMKNEIERIWKQGSAVLFEVDVYGGIELKKLLGDKALSVFIMPPSIEILESRLRNRNTETEGSIQKRLSKAREEIEQRAGFDHVVVNDELGKAVEEARRIVIQFLSR